MFIVSFDVFSNAAPLLSVSSRIPLVTHRARFESSLLASHTTPFDYLVFMHSDPLSAHRRISLKVQND